MPKPTRLSLRQHVQLLGKTAKNSNERMFSLFRRPGTSLAGLRFMQVKRDVFHSITGHYANLQIPQTF